MNRRLKNQLNIVRQNLDILEGMLDERPFEEPTAEEVDEMANWTAAADEPAKEGPYFKDLKKLTDMTGLTITGQIETVSDIKTYMKKDKSGIGLIYNIVLRDATDTLLCVFWDDKVEEAKKFALGRTIRITNAWKIKFQTTTRTKDM